MSGIKLILQRIKSKCHMMKIDYFQSKYEENPFIANGFYSSDSDFAKMGISAIEFENQIPLAAIEPAIGRRARCKRRLSKLHGKHQNTFETPVLKFEDAMVSEIEVISDDVTSDTQDESAVFTDMEPVTQPDSIIEVNNPALVLQPIVNRIPNVTKRSHSLFNRQNGDHNKENEPISANSIDAIDFGAYGPFPKLVPIEELGPAGLKRNKAIIRRKKFALILDTESEIDCSFSFNAYSEDSVTDSESYVLELDLEDQLDQPDQPDQEDQEEQPDPLVIPKAINSNPTSKTCLDELIDSFPDFLEELDDSNYGLKSCLIPIGQSAAPKTVRISPISESNKNGVIKMVPTCRNPNLYDDDSSDDFEEYFEVELNEYEDDSSNDSSYRGNEESEDKSDEYSQDDSEEDSSEDSRDDSSEEMDTAFGSRKVFRLTDEAIETLRSALEYTYFANSLSSPENRSICGTDDFEIFYGLPDLEAEEQYDVQEYFVESEEQIEVDEVDENFKANSTFIDYKQEFQELHGDDDSQQGSENEFNSTSISSLLEYHAINANEEELQEIENLSLQLSQNPEIIESLPRTVNDFREIAVLQRELPRRLYESGREMDQGSYYQAGFKLIALQYMKKQGLNENLVWNLTRSGELKLRCCPPGVFDESYPNISLRVKGLAPSAYLL